MNPIRFIKKLYDVLNVVNEYYKPKTRIIKISKGGIGLLRIGGYLLALINIEHKYKDLISYFSKCKSPQNLLYTLRKDPLIGGILYEKAARMYTGWLTHPYLWINISHSTWSVSNIPMVINGHVCKVLARTGFLPDVRVEDDKNMIVRARDERTRIEKEIRELYPTGDFFMIDFGAFYIGLTYCDEKTPNCSNCQINNLCAKNTQFRAY